MATLLEHAGYSVSGSRVAGAIVTIDGIEFIEMRPRDAGSWLAAGRLDAAFISTDIVLEEDLHALQRVGLGFAQSELVVANRVDDEHGRIEDLEGRAVATHLPVATARWFEARRYTCEW